MSDTPSEAQPGDNTADSLNATEAGDAQPAPTSDSTPEPVPETGLLTPAAGDGPHQPAPTDAEPSEFAKSWMSAVDLWIHGQLRNSPLAEATQAWNHVMAKLPLLGALVEANLSSKKE